MAKHDLSYYMSLTYPVEMTREEGLFVATHPDLPGCIAQGESADEAFTNLDDARESWIEVGLQDGAFIPEPTPMEFSGRLSLRIPSTLHARLARTSKRQGISLNQLINEVLTEWAGGISVKDAVIDEIRSLLSPMSVSQEKTETRTETKTETTTETRNLRLLQGGSVHATAQVGHSHG